MRVVEIPGGTASLREAHEIRQRDRRRVVSAGLAAAGALAKITEQNRTRGELETLDVSALGLTFEEAEAFQLLQKATIVASVAAWSRPEPVPTWDTVEDLPANVYTALEIVTAENVGPVLEGVSFSPPDPNSPGFEESPTPPSDGSDPVSRADQESESIPTQPTVGTSTGSDSPSRDSAMTNF
jgi:hypothetical protein